MSLKPLRSNCVSLQEKYPELATEWDHSKNEGTPSQYASGSNKKVWWICKKDSHHNWEAEIANRSVGGRGCPICNNKIICPIDQCNSLKAVNPDLAKEWDDKNNEFGPDHYSPSSGYIASWICSKNSSHLWKMSINKRNGIRKSGCPQCK